jgi:hypothetical protein
MEKVRNFLRNYLESEKFFSKFSYFLGEGKIFKSKKIFNEIILILKVENFSLNFRIFLKVKIFH